MKFMKFIIMGLLKSIHELHELHEHGLKSIIISAVELNPQSTTLNQQRRSQSCCPSSGV
jgi:hypothetical protein